MTGSVLLAMCLHTEDTPLKIFMAAFSVDNVSTDAYLLVLSRSSAHPPPLTFYNSSIPGSFLGWCPHRCSLHISASADFDAGAECALHCKFIALFPRRNRLCPVDGWPRRRRTCSETSDCPRPVLKMHPEGAAQGREKAAVVGWRPVQGNMNTHPSESAADAA